MDPPPPPPPPVLHPLPCTSPNPRNTSQMNRKPASATHFDCGFTTVLGVRRRVDMCDCVKILLLKLEVGTLFFTNPPLSHAPNCKIDPPLSLCNCALFGLRLRAKMAVQNDVHIVGGKLQLPALLSSERARVMEPNASGSPTRRTALPTMREMWLKHNLSSPPPV
jgi:hypothetical protein